MLRRLAFLLVRFRKGLVGESQRTCHMVPIPAADEVPEQLTALCGLVIERGTAELVTPGEGMPCEACLLCVPFGSSPTS
ncbi:hypothetical protein [Lentzea cavernae]|uniref:Uncharacterized protein n=1 Tax=Lentzea cavernae TaxID=2020703 RepID=A0ABQ3MVF2_9PSEU|nr:hypothetical protein [Lentzea cavernae]GHH59748.1 hypothetical protein GCM10017774_83050 [Lentzea cavernae]